MALRRMIQQRLEKVMDSGEAKAVTMMLFEDLFGLTATDVLAGKADELDASSRRALERSVERVVKGEPVQYVIGFVKFAGLTLEVTPHVLIPRPETEELVRLIVKERKSLREGAILDIGTGSGCIALALKKEMPSNAVEACDISSEALQLALQNAKRNGLEVNFFHHDILSMPLKERHYDIIVSNPPYICQREAVEMESHVVDYEPHSALFVPDDQPLLFYRPIATKSLTALKEGGALYFEANRAYAGDVAGCLSDLGYSGVDVFADQFGNPRMVRGFLMS